jgi:hypothetical protein
MTNPTPNAKSGKKDNDKGKATDNGAPKKKAAKKKKKK